MHTDRTNKLIPLSLFIFALCIRTLYLLELKSITYFKLPIMDALYHVIWARQIAQGDWLGSEVFFRAPLYPYFLGIIYFFTGNHFFLPRLIQLIMGAASCVLIFRITIAIRQNRTAAIIAGVIAATYWVTIFFEGELLLDSMGSFFNLLMLLFLFKSADMKNEINRYWFISGLFFGLSAITRPNILLFFPVIIWWAYSNNKKVLNKNFAKKVTLVCSGAIICIAPVTVRNAVVGKDFVLISSQAGLNFYIGNNPESNGWTAIAPGMRGTWKGGISDAERIAEMKQGKKLKPSEVSQYWFKSGLSFYKNHPLQAAKLLFKKCLLLAGAHEIKNNKDPYFMRQMSTVLRLMPLHYGIILPLAFGGLAGLLLLKRIYQKDLLIISFLVVYSVSIVMFFVCSRYRVPIVPILMIYSAFAIMVVLELVKKRDYKGIGLVIVVISVSAVISNTDFYGLKKICFAQSHFNLALNYYRGKDIDRAIQEYKKVLELEPNDIYACNNLASIYAQRKEFKKSIKLYSKALSIDPNSLVAYENLARLFVETGHIEKALYILRELLDRIPAHRMDYKMEIKEWYDKLSCYAAIKSSAMDSAVTSNTVTK